VTYTCTASGSSTTCTRTEAKPDGTSPTPAAPVVKGLSSASVFSYLGGAGGSNYVTATFEFPGQHGGTGIKVSDGAALRNVPTSYVPTS